MMRVEEEEDEGPQLDYRDPLSFLLSAMRCPDLPMHTRLRAAAEACKYSAPQLKAVAHVKPNADFAAALDRARDRIANAKVISLVPKAIEHDASELKPDVSRSPGANGSGFKRRF
jgi:hypothetical protein